MDTTKNTPLADNENIGLKSIIVDYLLQWKVFVVTGVVSLILAILYLILVPNTYEMMTRIQIQEEEGNTPSFALGAAAGLMSSFGLGGITDGNVNVDDEMAILTSNELLRKVIWELGMQVEYDKPGTLFHKMYKDSPLILAFDEGTSTCITDKMAFKVSIANNGQVNVTVKVRDGDEHKYQFEYASLPAVVSLPAGDFTLHYNENVPHPEGAYKMKMKVKPLSWIADDLAEELAVENISKNSDVVEIGYRDHAKARGTDLLNTLIRSYNRQYEEYKQRKTNKPLLFIEERILNMQNELNKTEQALAVFKSKYKLTDIEHDVEFYVMQAEELQKMIIAMEIQTHTIDLMNDFVTNPANKYSVVPMLPNLTQEGDAGGNSVITMYNQLLLERTQLLQASQTESPLLRRLNEQADQLREGVLQSIANAKDGYRLALAELKGKEKQLYDKMGEVPVWEKEYIHYKRQQEIFQGVYLILLQKKEEIIMSLGELQERARTVDVAFIKEKRVSPRKLYAGIGMIAFTLFVSIGVLFARKQWNELKTEYKKKSNAAE